MIEKLNKAFELQREIDLIEKEITPALIQYSINHHIALDGIKDIYFSEDTVSFTAYGYARGYFEENFSVNFLYFENPNLYIQLEKANAKLEKEKQRLEEEKDKEAKEKALFEKLKSKYEKSQN